MKFVLANKMDTLLPYLAAIDLSKEAQKHIVQFTEPMPYRSVGMVVHKHFVRKKILNMLQKEIQDKIAPLIPKIGTSSKQLMPI